MGCLLGSITTRLEDDEGHSITQQGDHDDDAVDDGGDDGDWRGEGARG